ncbi:MAG: DUF4143 domain-containing protein [Micrococcales bacterium]|nr:DUF4143 domain-containing protein [Micrococcales bacterium]MCL2668749.1 DUF4143 domain-containing protein [Micrococcales bacterium]
MQYRHRAVDDRLDTLLRAMGGVVVEGARACGKTSTGLQHARSSVRLDSLPQATALAELDPASLLAGDTPRLVDEWQLAPALWNLIRHEIDDRQAKGQFILSGSATPPDDVRRHSGAGRLARLRMRTMTLSESGRSSGAVSWQGLAAAGPLTGVRSPLGYRDLAAEAVRGGWPALLESDLTDAMDYNAAYLDDLCSSDITTATGVRHDPVRLRRLLASLARTIAGEATDKALATDVSPEVPIDRDTVGRYLDALTTVFAFEPLPAWSVALRSRTRLRTRAKIHLADPALACAALGVGPDRLARDPEYFGQVFEAMAIRDLRVYAEAQRAQVYHYRDETGLEIDAIVEHSDGTWAAAEVKLGASLVPAAERNLLRLRDARVDTDRTGAPRFLTIVTGTEYGYTLPSGVHVVPLATLRV